MNKNLEMLFYEIIEDEDLFNKFMEKKTLEDLYKFTIIIQDGYTEKELKKFLIKMINFVENKKFELLNDENKLAGVCGGVSMKNKTMSAVLASLMAISSMPTNVFASNVDSNYSPTSISEKNDNNFINKAKKAVAKFYDEHKKAIVGGGSVAAMALGAISTLNHYYTYDTIINKYIKNSPNISFDQWFERLGGTQSDIDQYCSQLYKKEGHKSKNVKTIQVDTLRIVRTINNTNILEDQKLGLLNRILTTWEAETHLEYIQGFDRFAVLAINKFIQCNPKRMWTLKDEAKMYYIYKTIVQTSPAPKILSNNSSSVQDLPNEITANALKSKYLYKYSPPNTIGTEDYPLYIAAPHYCICGLDTLYSNEAINLWDNIISDNNIANGNHFDSDKAFNKIAIVINSIWIKIYTESPESKDPNKFTLCFVNQMMRGDWHNI